MSLSKNEKAALCNMMADVNDQLDKSLALHEISETSREDRAKLVLMTASSSRPSEDEDFNAKARLLARERLRKIVLGLDKVEEEPVEWDPAMPLLEDATFTPDENSEGW